MSVLRLLRLLCLFWGFASLCLLPPGSALAARLTDDAGRTLDYQRPFLRVVSLYAAHGENLMAMGAGALLVGVSDPETGPPGTPVVQARDGAETIAALRPDLVLARPMHLAAHPGLIRQLESLGIAVVCLQPSAPKDLEPYWLALGGLTGHETQAREMAGRFDQGLAALASLVGTIPAGERRRVFFETIHRQMKTVSPESMAAFVLEQAGGINVAAGAEPVAGSNIAHFGLERLVGIGSQVDVYLAQKGPMNPVSLEEIRATPGFDGLKAAREGQVFLVEEAITSRPTLKLLDGMRQIGGIVYPQIFSAAKAGQ